MLKDRLLSPATLPFSNNAGKVLLSILRLGHTRNRVGSDEEDSWMELLHPLYSQRVCGSWLA